MAVEIVFDGWVIELEAVQTSYIVYYTGIDCQVLAD